MSEMLQEDLPTWPDRPPGLDEFFAFVRASQRPAVLLWPSEYAGKVADWIEHLEGKMPREPMEKNEEFFDSMPNYGLWSGSEAAERIRSEIQHLAVYVHGLNAKWWRDPATGQRRERNVGEMLMLVVSELSEAMEGHRKGLRDDKLPSRQMFEVEIADALIRLFDLAGGLRLDLGEAVVEKLEFNSRRQDHTDAVRLGEGGKKY